MIFMIIDLLIGHINLCGSIIVVIVYFFFVIFSFLPYMSINKQRKSYNLVVITTKIEVD